MKVLLNTTVKSIRLMIGFAILTGFAYPLAITGMANLIFEQKAQGSLLYVNGNAVGSELIGQYFGSPGYFWARPSATGEIPYDPNSSGGSNIGPTNPALKEEVESRVLHLKTSNPGANVLIPMDLVTASGSGLDPNISVQSALYQAPRIALERQIPVEKIYALIEKIKEDRQFGILGEPRINVLLLNLALGEIQ